MTLRRSAIFRCHVLPSQISELLTALGKIHGGVPNKVQNFADTRFHHASITCNSILGWQSLVTKLMSTTEFIEWYRKLKIADKVHRLICL